MGVLNDRLLSSVRDCNDNKISELAARTFQVAKRIKEEADEGNAVGFSYTVDKDGWDYEIQFEGAIAGDAIKGDIFTAVGDFAVTGVRC